MESISTILLITTAFLIFGYGMDMLSRTGCVPGLGVC